MKPETPYTSEELIQMLRDRQGGLTQIQFAAEIGISNTLLSDIYIGRRSVGNQNILAYLAPKGRAFVRKDCWYLVG